MQLQGPSRPPENHFLPIASSSLHTLVLSELLCPSWAPKAAQAQAQALHHSEFDGCSKRNSFFKTQGKSENAGLTPTRRHSALGSKIVRADRQACWGLLAR